jgi:C-terminal processing protease CtpA/Prc
LVEERVIVVGVFDEQLKRNGIKLGQEIVAINGISVKQYAQEKIMPYQNASTSQDLEVKTYDYFLFSGSFEEPVEVTLRNGDGKIIKRVIPRVGFRERWAKTNPPTPFEYRLLPGNVAYVALNTFNPKRRADEQFHEAFPQILKSDALILDIRDNGGGNSDVVYRILGHLTDKSFVVSKWRTRNYRPSFRAWGNPEGSTYYGETSMQPVKVAKPYLKPVVVLTSPRTYSAAEDFAVAFRVMKRGLIIGERTGGSTGQPLSFSLPGGGSAVVCTKRDTYPDGRDFVGIGVQPDRVARPTINDVLAGQDTVLNSALNELKNY